MIFNETNFLIEGSIANEAVDVEVQFSPMEESLANQESRRSCLKDSAT